MRQVLIGHPPTPDGNLADWLSRFGVSVNSAIDSVNDHDQIFAMPDNEFEGMFRVFGQVVLPDITHIGPWMFVEGEWRPVAYPTKTIIEAFDFTVQEPTALDTEQVVTFGAGVITSDATLTSGGILTFHNTGKYRMKSTVSVGRTGSSGGTVVLFLVIKLNGVYVRSSLVAQVGAPDTTSTLQFDFSASVSTGDQLSLSIYRDSQGVNEGGLYPHTSSIGANPSPSAGLVLERIS